MALGLPYSEKLIFSPVQGELPPGVSLTSPPWADSLPTEESRQGYWEEAIHAQSIQPTY